MSWADLYAGSCIEGKKMILRQLIDRVNMGRDFEIEAEFKISVTQFWLPASRRTQKRVRSCVLKV